MIKLLAFFGALFGATGVMMGSFGAHALRDKLPLTALNVFEIGVRYQLLHGLALFAAAWLFSQFPHALIIVSGWLFVSGTFLFSGSLYLLAVTGFRLFGVITPIGGAFLTLAWILLAIRLCLK